MTSYVGRFAPSPSGPLHFGSLVAALGSYFQAKANHGAWLVRIEDLDPPREMPGATQAILEALQAYQLHWDGEVVYQSQRHHLYQAQIDTWLENGDAYYCQCTRKQIKQHGGFYPGTCRDKNLKEGAIRLKMTKPIASFFDLKHGTIQIPEQLVNEDFIIKRRDGLFAYNLAVVLDDIDQGVTEVVRGADLIEPTGRQISLYQILGQPEVSYLHLPLAIDNNGNKLSKQNHATAIDIDNPKPALLKAMTFLGFDIPEEIRASDITNILRWGSENWQLEQLPTEIEITA
ncbi:tRNA glutamyl-Q(34) synthetase GluQRS [Vibrio natriegens]|uniref:Glutamyl-Q tRNA(Asp) synthetase n=1 Tax=Vibrio natriegens NBRC 15636 = ATCC 14048 = DSM 759 TaxID=1219067 RepID=A0AAN0Y3X3_VIBNA|nr:tRNA glutamyl-Q(34) synthetase GluQRS [Vibrio natriegens]ALR14693.1 glutamyl-tRNA synthetase [Vibrio natriegens NBRC 15636 = ATCC 14048 = DSM 759]ANQ13441.1 tRNA glutamyl-Q synthetase [Vibrio natriegens NBRC 15636 = ATCC 14048 = DSM 759]EPM41331.1 glutamyl-Q tRNA(Asp) ligase [Vibrio natriegens NBRC 15636 = ATCC 14048 = DSM 759]MDX6027882.1 tRNA glutamyl-Q(34) synthetase GluQRS [Vibrio natriegens NBRC 15636 = ATCC 14048 = DSM 759]UUI11184.1 tRNA glutamyl-Q(34) synthetase GluQRS [Vibrio natri